jgi:hypothetical protein
VPVPSGRIDGAGTSITWQRNERTLWRAGPDGSLVVLSPADRHPYVVEGSGAALWDALVEPGSIDEIATRLSASFGVARDVIARDIEPVLSELVAHDAVRRAT